MAWVRAGQTIGAIGVTVIASTAAITSGLAAGTTASATPPAAIVEHSDAASGGLSPMSYLAAGQVIHLAPQQHVTISYLFSCVRETITGGRIKVGTARSRVTEGSVQRETVRCDARRLASFQAEVAHQGEMAAGGGRPKGPAHASLEALEDSVELTIYDRSPLIDVEDSHLLRIERLDQPGEPIVIGIAPDRLIGGEFLDLGRAGYKLVPGGIYRATIQSGSLVFQVDAAAQDGTAPLAGRLIRF